MSSAVGRSSNKAMRALKRWNHLREVEALKLDLDSLYDHSLIRLPERHEE
jgi:hypothetical protein